MLDRIGESSLAAEHDADCARQLEEPMFLGLGLAFQEPLGIREPAVGDGERAAARVIPGQCEGDSGGLELLPAR
jgi:hypothetical protein